jgi:cytochrome c peroxidase
MMRRPVLLALLLLLALAVRGAAADDDDDDDPPAVGTRLVLKVPKAAARPYVPRTNPMTKEKAALGKKLFFEKALSLDRTIACASCHDPRKGYADGRDRAKGINGQIGVRSTPTILNIGFVQPLFWDGRVGMLEEQAKGPITNPGEMGLPDMETAVARVKEDQSYEPLFVAAYGDRGVTVERITGSIATFERSLTAVDSPFDRWQEGDEAAASDAVKRGFKLFRGKARCSRCHSYDQTTPFFTDESFHNEGIAVVRSGLNALLRETEALKKKDVNVIATLAGKERFSELGRFLVTGNRQDLGAWKTPSLSNVANTAPYMHDGSLKTLRDVVDFYDRGGNANAFLDGTLRPLRLTDAEKDDLVALLEAFSQKRSENFDQKELEALAEKALGPLGRRWF